MIEKLEAHNNPFIGSYADKINEIIDAINILKKFVYYAQKTDNCYGSGWGCYNSQEDLDEIEEFAGIKHGE